MVARPDRHPVAVEDLGDVVRVDSLEVEGNDPEPVRARRWPEEGQTGDFAELVPQEVEVVLAQPDAGIEPIRLTALQGGDGLWHAGPVTLPVPGGWEVTLRLLVTEFERVTLTDTLTLPD